MTSEKDGAGANQTQLELKYCERCGGLWLRPVGGGQIYCAGCAVTNATTSAGLNGARDGKNAAGTEVGDG
jgi:hypothetical protein